MKLSKVELNELADVAITAASASGQMIAESAPGTAEHKPGHGSLASQVVTDIDRASERIILDTLAPTLERFELGLLTEEQADDGGRHTADYFWCIDPLDGTLPFIEGVPGYAVSIALVGRDGTPWIGVIYDPVEATLLHAIRGDGAFRDGKNLSTETQKTAEVLSVFVDRSFEILERHDIVVDGLEQIAHAQGLSGVRFHASAGAVLNACGVLANPRACYFKFPKPTGGGSLWDFAATACLFREFGAIATDMHGDALDLNRADSTFMNHRGVLFATDEALAERIATLHV